MKTFLKWTGRVLAGVAILLVVATGVVYGTSERQLRQRFAVAPHPLAVASSPALVAQGHRLVQARGCTDCHGDNLTGRLMIDDPVVGRLAGPNITRGGRGARLADADWELAVRHGVRRDGSALLVMPSNEFTGMSDEDLAAIVAYARSIPADATPSIGLRVGPVPRALSAVGQMSLVAAGKIDHAKGHLAHVDAAPTVEFGRYLAGACQGCHGPGYSGGKVPGAPPDWKPARNITPAGIGAWSEAQFITALETGRRPDGSMIDTAFMPVRMTSKMTDVELQALYRFLRTVPARESGTR